MEKVKLNILPIETKTISIAGNNISILSYLPYQVKVETIGDYIDTLFSEEDISLGYLKAEGRLVSRIINGCTNLDVNTSANYKINIFGENTESDINENKININEIEYIYYSGIWQSVKSKIEDYEDFRQELDDAIGLVLKDKYSGKQVFGEITKFVDSFMNSDKVKDLVKELDNGSNKLKQFYPNLKLDDGVGQTSEEKLDPQIKLEMQAESDSGKSIESTESKTRKKRVKKF